MCVIWGADDPSSRSSTPSNAGALAPRRRVEVIPNAGHFPHKDHPQRFVKIVRDFIRSTRAGVLRPERWRELLADGPDVSPVRAEAAGASAPARACRTTREAGLRESPRAGSVTPSRRSGVAALLLDVRVRRWGRRCGTCERPRRPSPTLNSPASARACEGLDDDRLRVDVEEPAGGRAGVGEAEPVGTERVVVGRDPAGRSGAVRRACSRSPPRPDPRRRRACR